MQGGHCKKIYVALYHVSYIIPFIQNKNTKSYNLTLNYQYKKISKKIEKEFILEIPK